jgi:hypothetical protein
LDPRSHSCCVQATSSESGHLSPSPASRYHVSCTLSSCRSCCAAKTFRLVPDLSSCSKIRYAELPYSISAGLQDPPRQFRCMAEDACPVPLAVVSTCSNRPARMLQSRRTTGKAPQSLRCLKGSITRPAAREPRSSRHCDYKVDHQRPDHSTSTCNQSLWVGKGVAPPAAEHRWWIGFRDL